MSKKWEPNNKKEGRKKQMSIKMKELPESEKPYEKLEIYGAKKLSNAELLAITIKTGTRQESALNLAQKILAINNKKGKNNLTFLGELTIKELTSIKGIGRVKAIQILAVVELARRMLTPTKAIIQKVKTTQDVANLFMSEMSNEEREIAKLLILSSKNVILKIMDLSIGGTDYAVLEPKIVLAEPVKMQAPKIILVHNHPSGDPTPSEQDFQATDRIYEAANIMGIDLLDHVVIGKNNQYDSIMFQKKRRRREY